MHVHIDERPVSFPGCCLITNSSSGPFVVTEHLITQPPGSRFQVKLSIFTEIARQIGFVSSDRLAEALADNAELARELVALREELDALAVTHERLEQAVDLTLEHGAARHKNSLALRQRAPKSKKGQEVADAA